MAMGVASGGPSKSPNSKSSARQPGRTAATQANVSDSMENVLKKKNCWQNSKFLWGADQWFHYVPLVSTFIILRIQFRQGLKPLINWHRWKDNHPFAFDKEVNIFHQGGHEDLSISKSSAKFAGHEIHNDVPRQIKRHIMYIYIIYIRVYIYIIIYTYIHKLYTQLPIIGLDVAWDYDPIQK